MAAPSGNPANLFLREAIIGGILVSAAFGFSLWGLVAFNYVRPLSEASRAALVAKIKRHLGGDSPQDVVSIHKLELSPQYFTTFIEGCSVHEGICLSGSDRFYRATVTYVVANTDFTAQLDVRCYPKGSCILYE